MIKIPATSMQATFRSVTRNTNAYDDKTTTETGRHNTTRHKTKRYDTTIQSNTTARRHYLFDDIYKWRDIQIKLILPFGHLEKKSAWIFSVFCLQSFITLMGSPFIHYCLTSTANLITYIINGWERHGKDIISIFWILIINFS